MNIVAMQSSVFVAMLRGDFKEAYMHIIKFSDEQPEEIDFLVHFLYCDYYIPSTDATAPSNTYDLSISHVTISLNTFARMYVIADKFDIPILSTCTKMYYISCLRQSSKSTEHYIDILQSIATIYESTPPGEGILREHVAKYMSEMYRDSQNHSEGSAKLRERKDKILASIPEFGGDIFLLLMKKPLIEPVCDTCGMGDEVGKVYIRECHRCSEFAFYCKV